jgi:tetratricopeptide (TPR) repeat protein
VTVVEDGAGRGGDATAGPTELLQMVFARPGRAVAGARDLLAGDPTPYDASIAYQVLGLVERDFGNLATAIHHLRSAVRLARGCGAAGREGDAMASLGIALVQHGRAAAGLSTLRGAAGRVTGHAAARVRFRLAGALWVLGRHGEAYEEVRRAVPVLRRSGDVIWTARALTLRALINLALGAANQADRDFRTAERMFARTDQEHDRAVAVHNRGLVALRLGDLPAALAHLDDAGARYQALGTPMPDLDNDYCAVMLAAGLHLEALGRADAALARLVAQRGQATRRAELLLTAARAALSAGDVGTASARARAACRLFAAQRRTWWSAHGRLLLLQCRLAAGETTAQLVRDAVRCARQLAELGAAESSSAHLLAAQGALALGRPAQAGPLLAAVARVRHRGPALSRVTGWLARALQADAAGATRRTLDACRRGLAELQAHHLTLGAPELRAQATRHGAELAALATRTCLRGGPPRRLLVWSERWRATALAVPAVRPPPDQALQATLTRYREISSRLAGGPPPLALRRELRRLEQDIQARVRKRPGNGSGPGAALALDVDDLLAALGTGQLLEVVQIDGAVQVLLCGAGRVRRYPAGTAAAVAAEVTHVRATLHRLAHHAATSPERAVALLAAAGRRLEELLLGSAARHLGDGPLVVVPPGQLYPVPWALLPSLRARAFSVAPSARVWLRARSTAPGSGGGVLVVGGPGLPAARAEIAAVAGMYGDATVLDGRAATVDRVLAALDGCELAHLAVHGTFRADSPLFSALRLADGPLTVHHLERLRRAPHRLVLPSCESARLAPAGADELLGLASALLPLGTAGLVASVVPVNDAAAAPLMLALHHELRRGATLAEGLRVARASAAPDDPLAQATAWSFLALGAG